jgi:RNA polymerase sigma-54 factor
MQQAIQLLQLPVLELSQKIEQELAQNPVIEEITSEDSDDEMELPERAEEPAETDPNIEELKFKEEFDVLSKIDDEWRDYFQQSSSFYKHSEEDEEKRRFLENSITSQVSLQEHLELQIKMAAVSDEDEQLGLFIIGNINSNGFLKMEIEELADAAVRGVEDVQRVLTIIQGFDPNGVGSRNLRECLMLQLKNAGRIDSLGYKILDGHFKALGKKKYLDIAKSLKVKVQDVQDAVRDIMRLDLRPGQAFGAGQTQYIVPDVTVKKDEDDYTIVINDDNLPHLRISNFYRKMMQKEGVKTDVRDYIKDKIHSGKWLIKNIHQRHETLNNITSEILKRQRAFFDRGKGNLNPMTMSQIAEAVDLHESTVSRAIANKYVDTPHGLLPLKYFFTTAIETDNGKDVSSRNVKLTLQNIISKEDSKRPLSDEALVTSINDMGIKIARRTVAKYRKELGILPSHLRKEY